MKNKNFLIGIGVLVVIILAAGGVFFLNKSTAKQEIKQGPKQENQAVQTLSSDDIGLTLNASPDKKKIQFKIAKLTDAKTISYELTYEADSTAAEKNEGADARVSRGITGDEKITGSSYTSSWIDLGTCSSGTCRYDKGVTSIDLILKITKNNGNVYQSEGKLAL